VTPELTIGQLVSLGGRVLRVIGFDPMSVSERQVQLEDCRTGELRRVAFAQVDPTIRADVAAA